jgi:ATPase
MASKQETLVPDTSVLAEGLVTQYLKQKRIKPQRIVIPEAVLNELEHQANNGREVGYIGLDEVKELQSLAKKKAFLLEFAGERPGEFEIKFSRSGAVDNLIRDIARKEKATLMTADRVQALVAEAMGIKVEFVRFEHDEKAAKDPLKKFFDDKTMSLHLKEGAVTVAKRGKPGAWEFTRQKHTPDRKAMEQLAKEIVEVAQWRRDSFIEIERKGSTIVQLARYRIVITKPPFASAWEITAVRPVAHLGLKDYEFPEKFQKRLEEKAEGILVSGAPGEGKSTFVQALGEFYAANDKIVKTIEAPRDLVLPETITQYSATHGSPEEIRDVLLLNRPDYTIYDEIRNTKDFLLFADMRLSGVGMIGVVHATSPVDSIQRFIGRVELGMVPHIIDTVVFIKAGGIAKVYSLSMTVKTPSGMTEADLARPVVVVTDFYTGTPEYEIYTYGDQTTVVPVQEQKVEKSAAMRFAEEGLNDWFAQIDSRIRVRVDSERKATLFVPDNKIASIIGKGGSHIQELEEELKMSLDVQPLSGAGKAQGAGKQSRQNVRGGDVRWEAQVDKKNITIDLPRDLADTEVDLLDGSEFLATMTASKKAQLKVSLKSPMGKKLRRVLERDRLDIKT